MKQSDLIPGQIYAERRSSYSPVNPALLLNSVPAVRRSSPRLSNSPTQVTYLAVAEASLRAGRTYNNRYRNESHLCGYPVLTARRPQDLASLRERKVTLPDLLDEEGHLREELLPEGVSLVLVGGRELTGTYEEYERQQQEERRAREDERVRRESLRSRYDRLAEDLSAFLTDPVPQSTSSYSHVSRLTLTLDQAEELLVALSGLSAEPSPRDRDDV